MNDPQLGLPTSRFPGTLAADGASRGVSGFFRANDTPASGISDTIGGAAPNPASQLMIAAMNRAWVDRVLAETMHAVALKHEIERAVLGTAQSRVPRGDTPAERQSGDDQ